MIDSCHSFEFLQKGNLAAHIKRELDQKSIECSKILEELIHVKNQIGNDLYDKKQAINIDQNQITLTTASNGLSLKPDILRVPQA